MPWDDPATYAEWVVAAMKNLVRHRLPLTTALILEADAAWKRLSDG